MTNCTCRHPEAFPDDDRMMCMHCNRPIKIPTKIPLSSLYGKINHNPEFWNGQNIKNCEVIDVVDMEHSEEIKDEKI